MILAGKSWGFYRAREFTWIDFGRFRLLEGVGSPFEPASRPSGRSLLIQGAELCE
jgi:hypothetical protein